MLPYESECIGFYSIEGVRMFFARNRSYLDRTLLDRHIPNYQRSIFSRGKNVLALSKKSVT